MQPPYEQDNSNMSRPAKGTVSGLKAAAAADCLARDLRVLSVLNLMS
jgi:hypothetical protein